MHLAQRRLRFRDPAAGANALPSQIGREKFGEIAQAPARPPAAAWLPLLTRSRPLAAAGGGLLYGVGLACLVRADLSVGGTDLLERLLLARHPAVSIGRISLLVDGAMVLLSVAVYRSFWMGLYALAAIVLCSLTADGLLALARRAAAPGRP